MKRNEGESFEEYKKRRKRFNAYIKQYLKGCLFWDSSNGVFKKGVKR